jgi:hypothetical protein
MHTIKHSLIVSLLRKLQFLPYSIRKTQNDDAYHYHVITHFALLSKLFFYGYANQMISLAESFEINSPVTIPSSNNFVISNMFSGEGDLLYQMKIFCP